MKLPCRMCNATGLSRDPKNGLKRRPECEHCKGRGAVERPIITPAQVRIVRRRTLSNRDHKAIIDGLFLLGGVVLFIFGIWIVRHL